jgi:NTP pyrophosphatase (non-canonical NTP hydrolase)
MRFEELNTRVIDWAQKKGILDASDPIKQLTKTQEELDETMDALVKIKELHDPNQPSLIDVGNKQALLDQYNDEVIDGIGDMLVTIIILAEICGVDSKHCLGVAYEEIKDRKGKMVDGLFVKESNL